MKLSYAQCLEDYQLNHVLSDVAQGFYIDVGAGHPVADNVSYHFYLKGWNGLIVEPQQPLARLYSALRPRDGVIDHLVGDREGEVDFHLVDRLHGFSTTVVENAAGASAFGAGFRTEKRRIRPLSHVLDERGITQVDFLKIDVEGAEAAVLNGVNWQKTRPKILCIEAIAPGSMADTSSDWEPATLARGYHYAFSDGLNRFYVSEEEKHLIPRFPQSPTPWDRVTHFYELGKADENKNHPDYALAKRLVRGFLATLPNHKPEELLALLSASAGKEGIEEGELLDKLINGKAPFPQNAQVALSKSGDGLTLSDQARAALGRIAAQFDGGMVSEEEA